MSSCFFTPAAVEEKCQLLADSPEIGRKRKELAADLRSFPVGNYVIFYRPRNTDIQVIRILHAARDITPGFLTDFDQR